MPEMQVSSAGTLASPRLKKGVEKGKQLLAADLLSCDAMSTILAIIYFEV